MALVTDGKPPAAAHASAEIEIYAPRRFVWDLHTNVNAWPRWQPDIRFAVIEGPIAPGVAFRWHTHGTAITSIVEAVDEAVNLRWRCDAGDTKWFHDWTFTDRSGGVHVATNGSVTGESVVADPAGSQILLEQSLTVWLRTLKSVAESR